MPRRLPARPNLEHLRTQAKALLATLRDGDPAAIETFIKHLPEAASFSPQQVRERGFRLADAQAAIARKSGFAAWPGLARHVDRLRSMEGKWAFRSLEIDGQAMPTEMFSASHLFIDGDRFRMESPEANYEGIFVIDVDKTPHRIDIDFVDGPEAGNRCEGLFELDNGRFRICLGLAGSTRPLDFVTAPGSGHALEDLFRVDAARPSGVAGGTPPQPTPAPPIAANPGEFDGPLTPTLAKLQGAWAPVEMINSGSPLQSSYLSYGSRVQSGVETKVVFAGQTMVHAKVRVDERTTPLEMDYLNLHGKGKGSISQGLFRWDGDDEAIFCIGSPGSQRPDDFTSAKGSGRTFSRWRRTV